MLGRGTNDSRGYKTICVSDGCGSMRCQLASACADTLVEHRFTSPHDQSQNITESAACDKIFGSARSYMIRTRAPGKLLPFAIEHACTVNGFIATNAARGYKTPLELALGSRPNLQILQPWYCRCHALVPKGKRAALAKAGKPFTRAEPGRFLGLVDPFGRNTTAFDIR